MQVSKIGEFDLIAKLTSHFRNPSSTVLGPGDDAAVILAPDGRCVASTDMLVLGIHFRMDWSSGYDVGRKAAAQSLIDIAAMGARPTALLLSLACPGDTSVEWLEKMADGMQDECDVVRAGVVGGDVVSCDTLVLAITALGSLQSYEPLTRAGAQVGDVVAVVGPLGWSAAGYAILSRGFRSPRALVQAHRRPTPPYESGMDAQQARAHALCDVSDGLVADLGHIADASKVAINIETHKLPINGQLADAAAALHTNALDWLLAGGEDHALVGTFSPHQVLPAGWTVIGEVSAGEGVTVDGVPYAEQAGYRHFR